MTDTDWYLAAACRGKPTHWFYPEQHEASPGVEARALCAVCPVRSECLEAGLANCELGLWGGTSVEQRKQIRRTRPMERACTICGTVFTARSDRSRMCSDPCRTENHRRSMNRMRRSLNPGRYPSFTDDMSVLAITVIVALEAPAVPPAVKHQARELLRGGASWSRVADYVIQATKEQAA